MYCFTTSLSHGVENYFLRLWGTGTSDAIFESFIQPEVEKIGSLSEAYIAES